MAKPEISTKRLAISKANAQMVGVVAGAAFVTIFCLVAAKAAWSQNRYQARVTSADNQAHQRLLSNLQTFSQLQKSYNKFDSATTNVIGGNLNGSGQNDGSNSKIILDALPSTYDFPALTSSIEAILSGQNLQITSISGTDEQVSEQTNNSSPTPSPVSMPFSFTVSNANYQSVAQLAGALQNSIRPIQIDSMTLTGSTSNMTLTVNAHTYYQPGKSVNITTKEVQ